MEQKLQIKNSKALELRNLQSTENDKKMFLEGTAAVFEQPTALETICGIEYKEVIDRHAFDNTDFSYCCLKYNHDGAVHARVRGGSLKLKVDEVGLRFHAELIDTTDSTDLYKKVKEGLIDKCSFAFTVKKSEYDEITYTRRILEIDKVFDVSVVDIPAYEGTNVEARNFFELESKKNKSEDECLKRKRLLLMLG